VEVVAAAINPGEASIRKGLLHDRWEPLCLASPGLETPPGWSRWV
jgi:hypothetical protein